MVHCSLPCNLGGGWSFATLPSDVQDAAGLCVLRPRLRVDGAHGLLRLGCDVAHSAVPRPRFLCCREL